MLIIRRNILSFFISLSIFCLLSITSEAKRGYINATNVNIRSKPTITSPSLGLLSNQKVNIIGRSGNWYKISSGDLIGWVKADFICAESNSSKNTSSLKQYNISNQNGFIKGTNVNVRKKPSIKADIIMALSNEPVQIIGSSGDWYKISYKGTIGWIRKDFISFNGTSSSNSSTKYSQKYSQVRITKYGYIKGSNVNIRSKPTTTARIITALSHQKVSVLGQSGKWYKISTGKTVGWVRGDFIKIDSNGNINTTIAQNTSYSSSLRNRIVLYSRNFLGTRYRYGGCTPSGFDCSGFTNYVFNKFGIKLERVAADQAKQGVYVSRNNLQPGDLVFFDTDGGKNYINHVGIYLGNGKFIHASSSRKSRAVTISKLEGFYSQTYVTARRVIK